MSRCGRSEPQILTVRRVEARVCNEPIAVIRSFVLLCLPRWFCGGIVVTFEFTLRNPALIACLTDSSYRHCLDGSCGDREATA